MKKLIIAAIALVAGAGLLSAQNRKAVRLNEVMVENNASIVDDYGGRHGGMSSSTPTSVPSRSPACI